MSFNECKTCDDSPISAGIVYFAIEFYVKNFEYGQVYLDAEPITFM